MQQVESCVDGSCSDDKEVDKECYIKKLVRLSLIRDHDEHIHDTQLGNNILLYITPLCNLYGIRLTYIQEWKAIDKKEKGGKLEQVKANCGLFSQAHRSWDRMVLLVL